MSRQEPRPGRVEGTNVPIAKQVKAQRKRAIRQAMLLSPSGSVSWLVGLAADVGSVLLFAWLGLLSHDGGGSVRHWLEVAGPFLIGMLLCWSFTRAWLRPGEIWPTGVLAWLSTLVVGMLIRVTTGAGTATSFIVVAALVLAALLIGWRLSARVWLQRRARTG